MNTTALKDWFDIMGRAPGAGDPTRAARGAADVHTQHVDELRRAGDPDLILAQSVDDLLQAQLVSPNEAGCLKQLLNAAASGLAAVEDIYRRIDVGASASAAALTIAGIAQESVRHARDYTTSDDDAREVWRGDIIGAA